ncbi:Smarca5 protein [Conidiobolus coronatus NRRL 28638]|uniref:Smarca5 protein n=1 Tax=Conidiobolus coronatus (strain ATCC 28846 / CBS 209.66 / NRRL 28638) TaxID=796925 RepID=A0A137NTT3_CONC2|nr:Smarca5 protein [Conidiobolus coronatus NRRL 28638]|eukprot:KXN66136.1 Smarca5 protein [Conidiobolus coronatus NRRL 28638]
MVVLDRLLKRLKAQGSRVLIFSQMSRLLDILEDYCEMREYKYCRIDGQTSHEERIDAIDAYNAPDSEKFLFLLTTRAGGLGINLVTADIVIIFDSDWNPQADLQAQDRAHRIGQTKQVYVFRFVTENAIEEKVMERAAQKLRLDQLVIQQGRLSQQQKASSKEDLLAMIQHGAQDMFNSTESTVTEDDIDSILRRGEEKTKELTSKYSQIGIEDLAKFTSESTGSVYLWEGDDYNNKRKDDGSNIGNNWIQPAKRERKVNYAIDDYYREAMRVTPKNTAPRAPRPPKHPNFYDFQFLPKELLDIYQKEIYHYRRTIGYKAGSLPSKDDSDKQDTQEEIEAEQKKIDEAEPLTEEEQELKDKLSDKGFSNWSKREFSSFIKSMEKNGRDALDIISEEVENKTPEEVKEYYKVFWKRYTEISDYQKFIANIERGEQRLRRQNDIQQFLTTKLKQYKMPLFQLKIPYGQSKGKFYSEEEDRFLVIKLAEFGFGNEDVYERIRDSIRSSDLFRFNWFIKSRTSQEINRRCNTLVTLLSRDAGLNF